MFDRSPRERYLRGPSDTGPPRPGARPRVRRAPGRSTRTRPFENNAFRYVRDRSIFCQRAPSQRDTTRPPQGRSEAGPIDGPDVRVGQLRVDPRRYKAPPYYYSVNDLSARREPHTRPLTHLPGYSCVLAPLPAPLGARRRASASGRAGQHRTGHAFKPRVQASPATRVGDSAVKRTRTAQSVVSVRTAHVHVYTQTHMRHGGRPPSRSHECPTHGTLPPGRARVAHPTVSLRPRESYTVGGHFSPLEYLRSRHALHKSRKNVPSFRVYAFTCTSP